ncbi:MAG: thiamine pyrophosphate-binding protein [Dehalococcoidales bacterium]|nr:thiamine pyrophosphate-binding protein [Dehalococcoidales bacterium]
MGKVTGGRLVVKALKQEGIECIFALSGRDIDPIFQACIDEKVRLIDTRHEQAAAFMAEGWARATGKPGVAAVTGGPGVANAFTSIWNASISLSPTIVLGGAVQRAELTLGAFQEMDSTLLVSPITKWRESIRDARRIPEYISMAFRQALSGRPGPVYLELPSDVLLDEVEEAPLPVSYRTTARAQGDPALVKKAVEMLLNAKRPIVIAGSGVRWSGAGKELQEFIEMAKLPLTLTQMGRGVVPEDHPMCFGPTRVGTKQADVVLVVGTRLNYALNYGRPALFGEGGKWIQVDIEPTDIGRNRPIDIGIMGDAKAVLGQMIEEARDRCKNRQELPWVEECRAYIRDRQKQLEVNMNSDSSPVHPARLCKEVRDFLDRDATIVLDGGDITLWGAAVLRSYEVGHWLDNTPTGCLGSGTAFAMAAKAARPDKQVFLLNGDGSFGLNAMEFDTMVRHKLPVVCAIGNDGAWGLIKHGQQAHGADRVIGTELGFVRYDKMVEALGGYGEAVETPRDIRPALERAFASGLPACINVKCADVFRGLPRRSATK